MPRAVEATRPPGDARRQLTALRCLVLVRVNAGIMDEDHRVEQPNWLVTLVDLDRAETNRLETNVNADPVADTLDIC